MLFVLFIVVFAVLIGAARNATASAAQSNPGLDGLLAAVVLLVALAGIWIVVYLVVRLSFLLVPSVIDGGEFGLSRSWLLTKGNVWRIVVVGFATVAPIFLILGIAQLILLGPGYFIPDLQHAGDAAAGIRGMVEKMRLMRDNMPILIGLSFVVSPLLYGLLFSASAFAYRSLSGSGASAAQDGI